MRRTALAAVLLVLASCSYPGTATPTAPISPAASTPSPGGAAPPAPAPVTCGSRIPAAANLVLATLPDRTGISVRDISDLRDPVARCLIHGTTVSHPRFKDFSQVSYIVGNASGAGALYLADLGTRRTAQVRSWTDAAFASWVYAWSPDGKTLAYLSSSSAGVAWHLLTTAGDVTLSRFGPMPGRGINADFDDAMTGFSADGQYVALENTFTGPGTPAPFQIVRLSDHKLVYSRQDGTMAAWGGSGAGLYFRTVTGVEAWDPTSGVQVVVPGLAWIHPWPSADGLRMLYEAVEGAGNHVVGYLRLTDHPEIGLPLSDHLGTAAVFLNSTLVWYAEEADCAQTQCGLGGPPPTGRTFLYDLVTRSERPSIDTAVFDSWPHVGAA